MISGRQVLGALDAALEQVHAQVTGLQSAIDDGTERLLLYKRAQADDYRNLARVRLDRLSAAEVLGTIDQAERQALALLGQRRDALGRLRQRIAALQQARADQEQRRALQSARLDAAVVAVDEAEARTQSRLEQQSAYREQRELAEAAARKARHAADKAARSEQEREDKSRAFRDDVLFSYLWERGYGQADYRSGALVRWLDGQVARLIAYPDARANFVRLNEIPLRLRAHAGRLRSLADAEFVRLRARDEQARAAEGIPPLEEKVTEEQARLDRIDAEIAGVEAKLQDLLDKQASFVAGEDSYMRGAADFLAGDYRRDRLVELRREAFDAPYPDDDQIVGRMREREDEQVQQQASLAGLKGALERQQTRLRELERLRAEFKRRHYDRPGSVFAEDAMIPALLEQFLAGLLDISTLWGILQEQQRYRPQRSNTGFGSGGLGRGTVWRGGLGDFIGRRGSGGLGDGCRGGGGLRADGA